MSIAILGKASSIAVVPFPAATTKGGGCAVLGPCGRRWLLSSTTARCPEAAEGVAASAMLLKLLSSLGFGTHGTPVPLPPGPGESRHPHFGSPCRAQEDARLQPRSLGFSFGLGSTDSGRIQKTEGSSVRIPAS